MIDHVNLPVRDLERSREFYATALAPLGLSFLLRDGAAVGFGNLTWSFGIVACTDPFVALHVAFAAPARAAVDAFHAAALTAGATCNGPPGLRTAYGPQYYAAFVVDPDGYNVEAVCRTPPSPEKGPQR